MQFCSGTLKKKKNKHSMKQISQQVYIVPDFWYSSFISKTDPTIH